MRRHLYHVIFLLTLFAGKTEQLYAQYIPYYTFGQQYGVYTELTNGVTLDTGVHIGDRRYRLTLPFDFNLDGVDYRDIYIGGRGYISFGTTDPGTGYWMMYYGGSGFHLVAGFDSDIGGVSKRSSLSYDTLGTAPNRTFVVQWKDIGAYYNNPILTANFQIRLREGSNTVSIVYGDCSLTGGSLSVQVGLRGTSNASYFNRRATDGGWTSTIAGTSSGHNILYSAGKNPPNGLTYTFTPPTCRPPNPATNLQLTPNFSSVSGTFTASSPAANRYLILQTVDGAYPDSLPENGKTYSQNTVIGNSVVIYNGTSTSFSRSGLAFHTDYRYTVIPYNNQNCIGAPSYNRVNLLSATTRTPGPRRYTWVPQPGPGVWTDAGSWSPRRDNPHDMDTLVFDHPGPVIVEGVPGQFIHTLHITNRSEVRLSATGVPTLTIRERLLVDKHAALILENSRIILTFPTSSTTGTAIVDGTFMLSGRNIFRPRNATATFNGQVILKDSAVFIAANSTSEFNGSLVLQDSALYLADNGSTTLNGSVDIYNKGYFNYTGSNLSVQVNHVVTVQGSNASFANNNNSTDYNIRFGEKGEYVHNRDGGYIPRVTYDPNSTITIKGVEKQVPAFIPNVAVGNFVWNCPRQSMNASINIWQINGNLMVVNTGIYALAQATSVHIAKDFYQMSGTYNFPPPGQKVSIGGAMHLMGGVLDITAQQRDLEDSDDKLILGGDLLQHAGHVLTSTAGASPPVIRFEGAERQVVKMDGLVTTATISYKLKNPQGAVVTGNIPIRNGGRNAIHAGRWSGAGTFTYEQGSTLEIRYPSNYDASELEWPEEHGPTNLTVNVLGGSGNNRFTLPGTRKLSGNLSFGTAVIVLGDDSLIVDGTLNVPSGSVNRMIVTDGSGALIRRVPAGSTLQNIDFPVGNLTGTGSYAHARIAIASNPVERYIAVRTMNIAHPQNGGGTPRHWQIRDDQPHAAVSYLGYFDVPLADLGTESDPQLNQWNGANWLPIQHTQLRTSEHNLRCTIADTLHSGAGHQLDGGDVTVMTAVPYIYSWTGVASRDFQEPKNWQPHRLTIRLGDVLQFNNGQIDTVENIPTQTISRLRVINNTFITMNSTSSTHRTLRLRADYDTKSNELEVAAGSGLTLAGDIGTISLELTGDSSTGIIAGSIALQGVAGTYHNVNNICRGCVITITETGTWSNEGSGNTVYQASVPDNYRVRGSYIHKLTSKDGVLPTAIWEDGSVVYVSGYTTGGLVSPSGADFYKLIYDCPDQSFQGTSGNSVHTITVRDSLIIRNTGTGILDFGRNYIARVNHFFQTGGAVKIGTNASGTRALHITGSLVQTGGTIYGYSDSTFPSIINFNGKDGAQTASFFQEAPAGNITYQITNPAGVDLDLNNATTSDFWINRGGGITVATAATAPLRSPLRIRYATATSLQYSAGGSASVLADIFPETDGPTHLTINIDPDNQLILPGSRRIPGNLNMQSGNLYVGPHTLEIGSSPLATGNIFAANSHIILTTGALKRWYGISGLPLAPLNPAASGNNTGVYPIRHEASPRHASIYFTTGTALISGGSIAVSYNNAPGMITGLRIPDGADTVQQITAGSWSFTPGDGINAPFASVGIRVSFADIIQINTPSSLRLVQPSGAPGTHVAGSGTPPIYRAERLGLTMADMTAPFHIGAPDSSVHAAFFSVKSGSWHDIHTWNLNKIPGSADRVYISSGDTVAVDANASAYTVYINSLARLTMNSGTLIVDSAISNNGHFLVAGGDVVLGPVGGGNRTFEENGILEMTAGKLTVNGNLAMTQSSFLQTGGEILVDGNADGDIHRSVPLGIPIVNMDTREIKATGGRLVIVDPHAGSSGSAGQIYSLFLTRNNTGYFDTGHSMVMGDGNSVTSGGSTMGFVVGMHAQSPISLGNLIINGSPNGSNRAVTQVSNLRVNNQLRLNTPNAYFDMRNQLYVSGDIFVHADATWSATGSLYLGTDDFYSSPNAGNKEQIATGSGTITATIGGNFHNLIVRNPNGVHMDLGDVHIGHTLTLSRGILTMASGTVLSATNVGGGSQTSGWVNGKMRLAISTGTNRTQRFPIGNHQSYAPVTLSFSNVTEGGSATFSTLSGDHPAITGSDIMPTKSVNLVYALDSIDVIGSDMELLFSWQNADMDTGVSPPHFVVNAYSDNSWKTQLQSTVNNMTLQHRAAYQRPVAFQIGEPATIPVITQHPQPQSVCTGGSVTFNVVSHVNYAYQWQVNSGAGWQAIQNDRHYNGTTTPELIISSVTPAMDQNTYRCIITNSRGNSISNAALLQITTSGTPMHIALWSDMQGAICGGEVVTVAATVQGSGNRPDLQWFVSGKPEFATGDTLRTDRVTDSDIIYCLATDPSGCTPPIWSDTITVSVAPTVVADLKIRSDKGLVTCKADTVQFVADVVNGGSNPSYQWYKNNQPVGSNQPTYVDYSLQHDDLISCVAKIDGSCMASDSVQSNYLQMVVQEPVTPAVAIQMNNGDTLCAGVNSRFTAQPVNGGTPTYQWMLNGQPVGTNSSSYASTGFNDGDKLSVLLTTSLGCVTKPTDTSDEIYLTVRSAYVPEVTVTFDPSDTVCTGTPITFRATVKNGGTTPSYQWRRNNNTVGTNNPTYTLSSPSNNDVIICIVTSSLACASPNRDTSDPIRLTVRPMVQPSISIAASPRTSVCDSTVVTFTATPTNGGDNPTYRWMKNGATVGSNSSTYIDSVFSNGDKITCEITSNYPCLSSAIRVSNTLTMAITPKNYPTITIRNNRNSDTLCKHESIIFNAVVTDQGSLYDRKYVWRKNGIVVGNNSSSYSPYSALQHGDTITCELTSGASCTPNPTVMSNEIIVILHDRDSARSFITVSDSSEICPNTPVTFKVHPTNGGTAPQVRWYWNDLATIYTDTVWTYTPANGDRIYCQVTGNQRCVDIPGRSNQITMRVASADMPVVTVTNQPASPVCIGTPVTLTTSVSRTGSPSYQWKKNGVDIPGAVSHTYVEQAPANADLFVCSVTDSFACLGRVTVAGTGRILVMDPVVASASITVQPGTIINQGQQAIFTATHVNGGSAPFYQWKRNGLNAGVNSPVYQSSELVNDDEIHVEIRSSISCVTPEVMESNRIRVTVNPTSVGDVAHNWGNVSIYPNPNQGAFTIDGWDVAGNPQSLSVQVKSLTGQIIYHADITVRDGKFVHQIHLPESVANGIYFVWLQGEGSRVVSKIHVDR